MKRSKWSGGYVEWIVNDIAYLSVVFSWRLDEAYQRAIWHKMQGRRVRAGGPAITMNPGFIDSVADTSGQVDALPYHNPNATFTTRGCPRKCGFCAVPKIEGGLTELSDWPIKNIVCDNNILAASRRHFDSVIDKLKPLKEVDFNQGLDARLLTDYHAQRFTELDLKCIRLAWDNTKTEPHFMAAFETLRGTGIPASLIRAYVLIGFNDTPDDALYRLQTVQNLGAWPNPMRYQPLNAKQKNEYISQNWTDRELKKFMRYWSRLIYTGHIPFHEWDNTTRKKKNGIETSEYQQKINLANDNEV